MKREHNKIGSTVDPSLKFWFKGEEGRLIDEISGNQIVVYNNGLQWSNDKQAYLFINPANYSNKFVGLCDCDTGISTFNFTVTYFIQKNEGNTFVTCTAYPYREGAISSGEAQWLSNNTWHKYLVVWETIGTTTYRKSYLDGVLKYNFSYQNSVFHPGTQVALNYVNSSYSFWASFYCRDLKWYNRVFTQQEINDFFNNLL